MTFSKLTYALALSALTLTLSSACSWAAEGDEIDLKSLLVIDTSSNRPGINPQVAISSLKMAEEPAVFQMASTSTAWSGSLKKNSIMPSIDSSVAVSKLSQWDAGALLTIRAPSTRTIITYSPENKQTVTFELEHLPLDIQRLFNQSPITKKEDKLGAQRVSYLTGDRTMEKINRHSAGPHFGVRHSLLGNSTRSAPIYMGTPVKNSIGADFRYFYDRYKTRPGTVFVGANDGMLHAFSADSGAELFAYIPSPLLKRLPQLTETNSSYSHNLTMDGNIHVAEVKVSGGWKTVLAAGMGKGAKGLFALDVTQPDHFMAGNGVLFEFTEKDDPDIGYVTSAPAIAKMNTGKDKNGNIIYTYFVMVTSGYHSAGVHSNSGEDTTREHFLFLLSLDKNPMVPWSKNDNYYKISIDSNDTTTGNALSAPGLVLNTQRAVTYAYLGDLQGNLWRLDFRKDNPNATSPKLIFTAKDTHNNPQPITTQPIVSFAPKGGYLILFGTGNQEENARQKKSNHFHNSFYAIRDTTKSSKEDYFVTGRSQLAIRELVKTNSNEKLGYRVIGKEFTFGQSQSDKKGWYFDYPSGYQNGSRTETRCNERSVTEGFFAYETIFFNTVIPASTMCNESSTARSYSLNALTGKADTPNNLTGFESKVGTLGVPIIIAKQLKKSNPDFIGRQFNTQHYLVLNFGTGGANGSFEVSNASTAPLKAGRLSWREISNWQDLK